MGKAKKKPHAGLADTAILQRAQTARLTSWSGVLLSLIVLAMAGVLVRVVQLEVAPDTRLADAAGRTDGAWSNVMPRGEIYDRRGRILATSSEGYHLFVDPSLIEDRDALPFELSQIVDETPVNIDRAISKREDARYVIIARDLESWQIDAAKSLDLRCVGLTPFAKRHYPNGDAGASLIGLVGHDHNGLGGIEHRFNDRLTGSDGSLSFIRAANRQALWVLPDDYNPGAQGQDLTLSIDIVIQQAAEERLEQAVERWNAAGGRLIVLDSSTGELLAMCDTLRNRTGEQTLTDDPFRKLHPALGRNRCATDPYEPGSTFKPFVWARITELGLAHPDEIFPCPEHTGLRRSYGRRVIRDAFYKGAVPWSTVLIKSLNTGMALGADRMSHRQMQSVIGDFGFGHRTNCGIPGETVGLVTPAKKWTAYSQDSVAMGHEIGVTALQMVRAFSVFCRDGTMPSLRMTALSPQEKHHVVATQVISEKTARLAREVMAEVVKGKPIASEEHVFFGKSGTAQLPKPEGGGYFEHRYVSSFIAGAPLDQPRLVVLCVIDDPDRSLGHYGSTVAGPTVRDMVDFSLSYLGVNPTILAVAEGE